MPASHIGVSVQAPGSLRLIQLPANVCVEGQQEVIQVLALLPLTWKTLKQLPALGFNLVQTWLWGLFRYSFSVSISFSLSLLWDLSNK